MNDGPQPNVGNRKERLELVAKMIGDGKSTRETARVVGVSRRSIRTYLRELNITPRSEVMTMKRDSRREQFITFSQNGMTARMVADETGLSFETVRSYASKWKLKFSTKWRGGYVVAIVDDDVSRTLTDEARTRGLSRHALVSRLLTNIIRDKLVEAVIDDGADNGS